MKNTIRSIILLFCSLLFLSSPILQGQFSNLSNSIRVKDIPGAVNNNFLWAIKFTTGTSIPSTCAPTSGLAFYKTDTKVWYDCTDTNTFTLRGSGSGSGTSITWQGTWSSSTTYALNDAVASGGSSYISLGASNLNHTPASSPSNWGILASQGSTGATGSTGSAGTAGTNGTNGTNGAAGYTPQFIVASGVPSSGTGNNSDMYLNSATSDLYGPKASGSWGSIAANIKGATGSTGSTGSDGASVTVTSESAGLNCTNAGLKLVSASGTSYVCNGATGSTGSTGGTGAAGPNGAGYTASSTTSFAIGTGSKTFTTQAGLAYSVGARVRFSSAANVANYMEGLATSYSGTSLIVTIDNVGGSGTHTDWNINVSGDVGPTGSTGSAGSTGSTGSTGSAGSNGAGYAATSTSSIAIGTGSQSFTTQSGLAYSIGARVRASSAANGSNYMEGLATSYSGTTLVINVDNVGGSGTHTDWNINVGGDVGPSVELAPVATSGSASDLSTGTLNASRLPSTFSIAGPITLSGSGGGTELFGCGTQTVPGSPANSGGVIAPASCTGQHVLGLPATGATGSTQVLTATGAEANGITPTQWATPAGGGTSWNAPQSITTSITCSSSVFFQPFNDSQFFSHAYCNGSSTLSYYLGGQVVTPIGTTSATYAWTNQVSAVVTKQTNGIWSFDYPSHGATSNAANVYDTATPSVPFTKVFRLTGAENQMAGGGSFGGPSLRESGTGKMILVMVSPQGTGGDCGTTAGPCIAVYSWTAATSPSVTVLGVSSAFAVGGTATMPVTIKITVATGSTGNITISWSPDGGFTYQQIYQAAKNTFFSTGPDNIGVTANNNTSGNKDVFLTLLSID